MKLKRESFIENQYGKEAAKSLQSIGNGGSPRQYFRFISDDKTLVLSESKNVAENETFFYFTQHFSKIIPNLPEIKIISEDKTLYVQKDLGNVSLLNLLESNRESAKEIYKKALLQLVKMQIEGNEKLDYSKCFSYPRFNDILVLRDLFNFKNYFLNLLNIDFNQAKLLRDFERFSLTFEKIPTQYFCYRDFQSRNIMVKNNEPYFIDYQGGNKGPIQYDLVSLLWQAKANLSSEWKKEFYEIYTRELLKYTGDLDVGMFRNSYDLCLLERLLQVLGVYGFRGIVEGKKHFFESIQFGLNNLKQIIDYPILDNYPELKRTIEELIEERTFIKIEKKIHDQQIKH